MATTGGGGTAAAMAAGSKVVREDDQGRGRRLSPRQVRLDRLWSYYRCEQYSGRKVNWDGSRNVGQVEHDSISIAGFVPPGFYIANSETLPIGFRKPTTPYHLCKVITDRFTGLLFSQKRHPAISVEGDEATEQFLTAVVETGRLWPAMMQARAYGGAVGTAVIGFKLVHGKPYFEVFDPRWCVPKFLDRSNMVLSSLEYRYTFKLDVRNTETGEWDEVEFWFRRVIDTMRDIVYEPERVTDREPQWRAAQIAPHGSGFCPIVWVQNIQNMTDIDGDSDCQGIHELAEAIDRLNAQAEKGIIANCDPTVVITTDAAMGEIKKGSNNAIKLPANSTATYMEMVGAGIIQAREQAKEYKMVAFEVAQCVLEQPDGTKTATEVDRNYASMLAKADMLREQYGELGVKRLLNMVLVISRRVTQPRIVDDAVERNSITLPSKVDPITGLPMQPQIGPGPYTITLVWPPYFEANMTDIGLAVTAASAAKSAGLIDDEHAIKFVAPYFHVEDIQDVLGKVKDSQMQDQAALEAMALGGAPLDDPNAAPGSPPPGQPPGQGGPPKAGPPGGPPRPPPPPPGGGRPPFGG